MTKKTLLAVDYPSAEEWKTLLRSFSPEAIAHKLLLSSVPYVFRNEPFKFALFRRTIAVTAPEREEGQLITPQLDPDTVKQIGRVVMHAGRGIWRPDSLPQGAAIREEFFDRFNDVSLKVLGLQLSEDTVAKVNGRIARPFGDAVADLADSVRRLRNELEYLASHSKGFGSKVQSITPGER